MFTSKKTVIAKEKKQEASTSETQITQRQPREKWNKLRKILLTPDGTELTLEETSSKITPYVIFISKDDQTHKMELPEKIDNIFLVPNTTQFLTWYLSRKNGITVSRWDWSTQKKLDQMKLNDDDLDKDGLVHMACTQDIFILYYPSNEYVTYSPIPGESVTQGWLELRKVASFDLISKHNIIGNFYFTNCIFSPPNPSLAVFINSNGFECLRLIDGEFRHREEIQFDEDSISCMDILLDGKTLVSGHKNGVLRFWKLGDTKESTSLITQTSNQSSSQSFSHPDDILSMIVIPDGKHLVSWNYASATLWDISDIRQPQILNKIQGPFLGCGEAILTPDWKIITPLNCILTFEELIHAHVLTDLRVTGFPQGVSKNVLDYLFFKPQPVDTQGGNIPSGEMDIKPDKENRRGIKRTATMAGLDS